MWIELEDLRFFFKGLKREEHLLLYKLLFICLDCSSCSHKFTQSFLVLGILFLVCISLYVKSIFSHMTIS